MSNLQLLLSEIRQLREEAKVIRLMVGQSTRLFYEPAPLSSNKAPFASIHESPPSVQDLWLWPSYPSGSCSR